MCSTNNAVWWTRSWLISTRRQMSLVHGRKWNVPPEEFTHEALYCFVHLQCAVVRRLQPEKHPERERRVTSGIREQEQSGRNEHFGATAYRDGGCACPNHSVE